MGELASNTYRSPYRKRSPANEVWQKSDRSVSHRVLQGAAQRGASVLKLPLSNLCHSVLCASFYRKEHFPCPSFPCFFGIPCFFRWQGIHCFFERFSLLFQGFWGFGRVKKSLLFWWFSLPFSKKKQGKEGQGFEGEKMARKCRAREKVVVLQTIFSCSKMSLL